MGPLVPLGSGTPESQPINRPVWVMPRDSSSGALGFVEGEASRDWKHPPRRPWTCPFHRAGHLGNNAPKCHLYFFRGPGEGDKRERKKRTTNAEASSIQKRTPHLIKYSGSGACVTGGGAEMPTWAELNDSP